MQSYALESVPVFAKGKQLVADRHRRGEREALCYKAMFVSICISIMFTYPVIIFLFLAHGLYKNRRHTGQ